MNKYALVIVLALFNAADAQAEPLIWPKKVEAVAKTYNCSQPKNFYATVQTEKPPFAFFDDHHMVFWCADNASGELKLIQHAIDPKPDYFPGCSNVVVTGDKHLGGVSFTHVWVHDAKLYYEAGTRPEIPELYVLTSEYVTPRNDDLRIDWVCIDKQWVIRPAYSWGEYIPW